MRVSVTLSDEINSLVSKVALEKKISKDKFLGNLIVDALLNVKTEKIHNERGAGRKRLITDEEIKCIKYEFENGKSIRSIAKEFNYSHTYISKVLKNY